MRIPLLLFAVAFSVIGRLGADESKPAPFDLRDGDRVLFIGDTLLEREGNYGRLESRLHERFAERQFVVRNLAFSADTPAGISRASFDPAAKGFERVKEQLALVKPTVAFLGYGMAASLQEMTDRSGDVTLNADPARYGEAMSVEKFKAELAQLMDAIEASAPEREPSEIKITLGDTKPDAGKAPAIETKHDRVRFVLLAPLRHEDLRAQRPELPDPTTHNKLLEAYSKAIEELAKERGAIVVTAADLKLSAGKDPLTDNGIHLSERGYERWADAVLAALTKSDAKPANADKNRPAKNDDASKSATKKPAQSPAKNPLATEAGRSALREAVIRKNLLFFHRWRPENSTYLFGFRKHEQGRNAVEVPQFDTLVEAADAEIDKLKRPQIAESEAGASQGSSKAADKTIEKTTEKPSQKPAEKTAAASDKASDKNAETNSENPDEKSEAKTAKNSDKQVEKSEEKPPEKAAEKMSAKATEKTEKQSHKASEKGSEKPAAKVAEKKSSEPEAPKAAPQKVSPPPLRPLPEFTVAEGFKIELWAENPLLEKPIQMNWDARGRLWVATSNTYPQVNPEDVAASIAAAASGPAAGDDKIMILEDTDHDGLADKSTVFASGLLIPTGIAPDLEERQKDEPRRPAKPGEKTDARAPKTEVVSACYVGASTELLRLADTNGDGKADTRRIVLSGFGTEDTHHIIHTLHWGHDGRLYFNQSIYIHSHIETPWGVVRANSGAVLSYDPRSERVEVFDKGYVNSWGHQTDRWGQSFQTDGAGSTGVTWGIPGAMFAAYEGARRIFPSISPGSYPKMASLELISSPHFPEDWQGDAITNDFRAHRVVHFKIEDLSLAGDAQAGYVAKEQPDFIRTTDVSFRPIDVRLGPDGALYIADWSNPVINHGEVDFRDPRRDHYSGRIWRVTHADTPLVKWQSLLPKTNAQLLDSLLSESQWEKEQARRILSTRGEASVRAAFDAWTEQHPDAALEALWLSEAWDVFPGKFIDALAIDNVPQRRAATARSLGKWLGRYASRSWTREEMRQHFPRTENLNTLPLSMLEDHVREVEARLRQTLEAMSNDENPRVLLEVVRAVARTPSLRSADLVLKIGAKAGSDPFLDYAAWLSINELATHWTDAIANGAWKADGREAQLAWGLSAIDPAAASKAVSTLFADRTIAKDGAGPWIEIVGKAGGATELRRVMDQFVSGGFEKPAAIRALTAIADAARLRNVRPGAAAPDPNVNADLQKPGDIFEPDLRALQRAIADTDPKLQAAAARLAGLLKKQHAAEYIAALATSHEAEVRAAAFDALRDLGGQTALSFLGALIQPSQSLENRRAALAAIAQIKLDAAVVQAPDVLASIKDENTALETWRALLGVNGAANAFAVRMPKDLPAPVMSAALRAARELGRRGEPLVKVLAPTSAAPATASVDMVAAISSGRLGNPARGELVYRRANLACVVCHAIGGAGGKVGPELTSLGASAPLDYIIESVLNPAAKVKEGFNAITLNLRGGGVATGIQSRETATEIFLRDASGREQAVVKANVETKQNVGSIMPAGLVDALPEADRADLFAFLGQLGRPGPFDASKGSVARAWALVAGAEAPDELPENPARVFTLVDGRLPKEMLSDAVQLVPERDRGVIAVAKFQASGKTKLHLTGSETAWLDGKPLTNDAVLDLASGEHTLAVKLDAKALPELLRAESAEARFLAQ